jgi:hypothetical protein
MAAFLISEPVGPLTGNVEHAPRLDAAAKINTALRNIPPRRGTQIIIIQKPWRRSETPRALNTLTDWKAMNRSGPKTLEFETLPNFT